MKAKLTRRVVTGHRVDGRSTVLMDTPAPNVKQRAAGNASTLLWVTDESPAALSDGADRAARDIAVPPPRRGTIFRIAEFPPGMEAIAPDNETLLRDFGIGDEVLRGHPPRDPAIHRTRSLDYIIVLEGEIVLLLDETETTLRAGDVVVQQATNHAWVNRSAASCRLAMVFIDAEEPKELA
ncbi:MAG: cupin domain-containing protein [Betaproteobacteria bacterium]